MNYKESTKILEKINTANNILLAFHNGVDPDSIASNLVMRNYLVSIGKNVQIIYCDEIASQFRSLYHIKDVSEQVDLEKFDFGKFDIFITLDINELRRLGSTSDLQINTELINIDHHASENTFNCLKINDSTYSSTAEMIYFLLEDFEYKFTVRDANLILLGIITDTESFNYSSSARVFETVSSLMKLGADFDNANVIVYRNNTLNKLKFWSLALNNMKVDEKYGFAYTTVSFDEFAKVGNVLQGGRSVADKFARTLVGTDFGVVMTEQEKGKLKISIRSRESGFGLLGLLRDLGGGGHFDGGGAMIEGLPFEKAVAKTLKIIKKYVKDRPKI